MRASLIMGNWKMHGDRAFAQAYLSQLAQANVGLVQMVVLVPYPYLALAEELLSGTEIAWGAQNTHDQPQGAYTGEVSATMLKDMGCQYVLVGHSERRQYFGEDDAWLVAKYKAVLEAGMQPVFCVGEDGVARDQGQAESVILAQLSAVFEQHPAWIEKAVVAYEPVWAIGTGQVARVDQVEAMHGCIRQGLEKWGGSLANSAKILYGGSVKPGNAASLLAASDVDGALVGGASLDVASLLEIAVCTPSF